MMRTHFASLVICLSLATACSATSGESNSGQTLDISTVVPSSVPSTTMPLAEKVSADDATVNNQKTCWEFNQPVDPSTFTGDDVSDSAARIGLLGRNSSGRLSAIFSSLENAILAVKPYYDRDEFPPQQLIDSINQGSKRVTNFCAEIQMYFATSTSSSAAGESLNRSNGSISCAKGGRCEVGDVGPGGGIVIVARPQPESWGQFIEAAPKGWNGSDEDPVEIWCDKQVGSDTLFQAFSFGIGSGKANSVAIKKVCKTGAVATATSYRGGGKSDWYLPSVDEVRAFVAELELSVETTQLTDSFPWYWTSTSNIHCSTSCAHAYWPVEMKLNEYGSFSKGDADEFYVRPVRAFQ